MLSRLFRFVTKNSPLSRKILWKWWYQMLARRYMFPGWTFMNYGYAPPEEGTDDIILKEEDEVDRYCIQLYHQIASAVEIEGKEVLEVGSGRGGGCSYIARYMHPLSMTGMDLSNRAVKFCRRRHKADNLSFLPGDAEALPFDDGTIDAVVNVESSHCYGSMSSFLSEVRRVLKSGGHLLFADLRGIDDLAQFNIDMTSCGMRILVEEDITKEVMRAMERDSERKSELIKELVPKYLQPVFRDFAGIVDTRVYNGFKNGEAVYKRYVMQK